MDSDLELVKRCLRGDDAAWEALLRTHTNKIYNLCYRFTSRSEDAEDLTQEVFIKVFRTLKSYDPHQAKFATWISRIARNHLVDHYRRTRGDRMTSVLDDQLPIADPSSRADPTSSLESRERRERLQAGLSTLSPDLREAVILRDLQDLDYAEIAQVLQVPEGTVKSRINRGRLELGRALKRMDKVKAEEAG
ncbi:MAG TPA: sigma-70 family RNA polymerase sigma factor [Terriglobia bacterium]|nr:sigma-70 family RNA polymerase sigma factor [Terriglobia bacterium]